MKRYSKSLVIRELQIKTTMGYRYRQEWIKLKRLIIPSADKDVEQLELSHNASGNLKW